MSRAGDLFFALVSDVGKAHFDQSRLEFFIIAMLHIPQHDGREAVFFLQAFERVFVHAARGDQNKAADFVGILLRTDLRDHAAGAAADENRPFDADLWEKRVHPRDELPIRAKLPRIIKQQRSIIARQIRRIIDPHFRRVHPAV